jgi:hypothetical protein
MADAAPAWKQTLEAYWYQEGINDNERALLLMDMLTSPQNYDIQPDEVDDFRIYADELLADITGF